MAVQEITLRLPVEILQQIERAAAQAHRTIDDVLVEAVIAAAPTAGTLTSDARSALAQMAYMNDAALWQTARSTMNVDQRTCLADLHDKQQREGLTDEEQSEEGALLDLYRGTLLVRARAALLLKQRGYDIADPGQFTPLH